VPGRWSQPSLVRSIIGWVSLAASLIVLVVSAVLFIRALEFQGYGSPEVRVSLVWMGAAGALLATGIALLIWEYSVRYDIPH
jgi:hypothetical protein